MSHIDIESNESIIRERYELVSERIREIAAAEDETYPAGAFFGCAAGLLCREFDILEQGGEGQEDIFAAAEPYGYLAGPSELCPDPVWFGKWAYVLMGHLISVIPFAYEGDLEEITLAAELFSLVHGLFAGDLPAEKTVRDAFYYHFSDNFRSRFESRIMRDRKADASGAAQSRVFDIYYGEPCRLDEIDLPSRRFAEEHYYDLAAVADKNFCAVRLEAMGQVYEKHKEEIVCGADAAEAFKGDDALPGKPEAAALEMYGKQGIRLIRDHLKEALMLRGKYTGRG